MSSNTPRDTSVQILTEIQESIIDAIEVAADTCDRLASQDTQNANRTSELANKFVQLIQDSQQKLLVLTKRYTPPIKPHTQPYLPLAEALVVQEQLKVAKAALTCTVQDIGVDKLFQKSQQNVQWNGQATQGEGGSGEQGQVVEEQGMDDLLGGGLEDDDMEQI